MPAFSYLLKQFRDYFILPIVCYVAFLPFYFMGVIHDLTGDLKLNENIFVFIFLIFIAIIYYGLLVKYMGKFSN
ncbi:MAG: hypothetical protein P8H57_00865 [Emcibacteraceae bacterium]|nr:hypothetical protein [Emcibacteraceae bacterium]